MRRDCNAFRYFDIKSKAAKNTGRLTLFMSDRQSWFGLDRDLGRHDLALRGRVIAEATGNAIITFTDFWAINASSDTAWPGNRCERMFVSPGAYRFEIVAFDRTTNLELAHCSDSIEIPNLGRDGRAQLSLGTHLCEYQLN